MYIKIFSKHFFVIYLLFSTSLMMSCKHDTVKDPNEEYIDMRKYDNPNNLYRKTITIVNDTNPSLIVEAVVMIVDDNGNALVATNNDGISFDTIKRPYREYQRIFDEVVYQNLYKVYTPYTTTIYFDANRGEPQVFYKLLN